MLSRECDCEWEVIILEGKGMYQLSLAARAEITRKKYDIAVLVGGICDITRRNKQKREITVRTTDKEEQVRKVFNRMEENLKEIRKLASVTLIATTYGLDLPAYNFKLYGKYVNPFHTEDQRKVSDTVCIFNEYVTAINAWNHLGTIHLGNKIHHRRPNGSIASSYKSLWDGCHPDLEMVVANAKDIWKIVRRYVRSN